MTFDMNDADPQMTGDLIPDGSFAKVTMAIRPGGTDGQSEIDQGLLKTSNSPGSDVLSLDCEFTVVEGMHAKRKFWQKFTVSGGKVDDNGVSIGWKISKSTFRAMIDSALGLKSDDMSDEAKTKRVLRGLKDLDGIAFVAKIKVKFSTNPQYSDSNQLEKVVLPEDGEWQKVLNGENVPVVSTQKPRPVQTPSAPASNQPAWNTGTTTSADAAPSTQQTTTQPPAQQTPQSDGQGPAWLNT